MAWSTSTSSATVFWRLLKLCKVSDRLHLALGIHHTIEFSTTDLVQRNESIRLKEEYHAFRDRSAMCLVCFAAALITGLELSLSRMATGASLSLTPPMMVVVQLFLSWLLYWYTAMALRENVLKVRPRGSSESLLCTCFPGLFFLDASASMPLLFNSYHVVLGCYRCSYPGCCHHLAAAFGKGHRVESEIAWVGSLGPLQCDRGHWQNQEFNLGAETCVILGLLLQA